MAYSKARQQLQPIVVTDLARPPKQSSKFLSLAKSKDARTNLRARGTDHVTAAPVALLALHQLLSYRWMIIHRKFPLLIIRYKAINSTDHRRHMLLQVYPANTPGAESQV